MQRKSLILAVSIIVIGVVAFLAFDHVSQGNKAGVSPSSMPEMRSQEGPRSTRPGSKMIEDTPRYEASVRSDPFPGIAKNRKRIAREEDYFGPQSKEAWFLCHRIRFSLVNSTPSDLLRGTVEADETYIGGKKKGRGRGYVGNKTAVVSLVEREGRVRSQVVEKVSGKAITRILKQHVSREANLNTDESRLYRKVGRDFASHDVVNHGQEEYSRDDKVTGRRATTNAVEGFFGNSKRALDGTHHHISKKHTNLYFAELDYKYNTRTNTDGERTVLGIKQMAGKRLMLRRPSTKA